ncbi:MAG: helix-turn-helix transcriptional regulator [Tissierellia bacterium]|nr:helix-turn-helix transcriptional regulator [Tissierellia bacterium]
MNAIFQNRLRELRRINGFSQTDIADKLEISTSAYGFYEQGKTIPSAETIVKLSDYFSVTADYLLGRSIHPKLNRKDEVDIQRDLDDMKLQLESGTLRMSLDGEELDDEIKQFIIDNMENTLILAKIRAKEKFTPKRRKK